MSLSSLYNDFYEKKVPSVPVENTPPVTLAQKAPVKTAGLRGLYESTIEERTAFVAENEEYFNTEETNVLRSLARGVWDKVQSKFYFISEAGEADKVLAAREIAIGDRKALDIIIKELEYLIQSKN
jgi:hypothetical protein